MKDYSKGKIYCIRSHKTDLIYIGSTVQPLYKRLNVHKGHYRDYIKNGTHKIYSYKIFELDDKPYIELIKNYPCDCKDELDREEGKYIRAMECVNKVIPGRTPKEYYEDNKDKIKEYQKEYHKGYQKKYYNDNEEKIKEYYKEYYNDNKEKIKKQTKEYREQNKEKIKEKNKKYYNDNKEKINQKITCECGSTFKKSDKKRHEQSKKHINFTNY